MGWGGVGKVLHLPEPPGFILGGQGGRWEGGPRPRGPNCLSPIPGGGLQGVLVSHPGVGLGRKWVGCSQVCCLPACLRQEWCLLVLWNTLNGIEQVVNVAGLPFKDASAA